MTQKTLDTGDLVDVMVRLAAIQEPPVDSSLVRAIIEAESAYIENRATARDHVEDAVETSLRQNQDT